MADDPEHRESGGSEPATPSVARMYEYWLGGSAHYEVDRKVADQISDLEPLAADAAWANRGFLQRAAAWMAEQGIAQFVDVGAGLPTANNTHDVVRRVNPDARVLYVDNDEQAVSHGRELTADLPGVSYLAGDLRNPRDLWHSPELARGLDPERPVGLLIVGLCYFVADPYEPVAALIDALSPGSYLALSHLTADHQDPTMVAEGRDVYAATSSGIFPRTRAEVERLFDGMEFVPPYSGAEGRLAYVGQWGAEDSEVADDDAGRWLYAGVARKP